MKNGLIINPWKFKEYWLNDQLHRDDGPALDDSGVQMWFQYGKLHRLDGPAVFYPSKDKSFEKDECWFHGKHIDCSSQKEFEEAIKLAMFW